MILVLSPDTRPESPEYKQLLTHLANLPGIATRVHTEVGSEQTLTEVYLIGNTKALPIEDMQSLPCVERVVRMIERKHLVGGEMGLPMSEEPLQLIVLTLFFCGDRSSHVRA